MPANFNSHARVGRDGAKKFKRWVTAISTHTPAWGVTYHNIFDEVRHIFQLTRPRGA